MSIPLNTGQGLGQIDETVHLTWQAVQMSASNANVVWLNMVKQDAEKGTLKIKHWGLEQWLSS